MESTAYDKELTPLLASGAPTLIESINNNEYIAPNYSDTFNLAIKNESSIANFTNETLYSNLMALLMSAIGAGMLSIPLTFSLLPPYFTLLLLCFVGLSMAYTANILLRSYIYIQGIIHEQTDGFQELKQHQLIATYQSLAKYAGGQTINRLISFIIIFGVLGACVGCIRVVKDLAPLILFSPFVPNSNRMEESNTESATSHFVWGIFIFISLPLGYVKQLSTLKVSSYVGFGSMLCLVIAVAFRSLQSRGNKADTTNILYESQLETMLLASVFARVSECFAIYNFCFMLHLNVLPLLTHCFHVRSRTEESQKTKVTQQLHWEIAQSQLKWSIITAIIICVVLYGLFGLSSKSIYGFSTNENILLNLQQDSFMVIPCICILLTVFFSFPLLFHPLRELVLEALSTDDLAKWVPATPMRMVLSITLMVILVFSALQVSGISFVFSIVGSSVLFILCYVFPISLYLWLDLPSPYPKLELIGLILLGIIASTCCIRATISTIFG